MFASQLSIVILQLVTVSLALCSANESQINDSVGTASGAQRNMSSHPALNRAQKTADNNKMMKLPIIKSAGKGLLPYFPEVIDIAIDFSSGLPMIQVILDDQPLKLVLDFYGSYIVVPDIKLSPNNGYKEPLKNDGRELRGFYSDTVYPIITDDYSKTSTIQGKVRNGEIKYVPLKKAYKAVRVVFMFVGTMVLDAELAIYGLGPGPGQRMYMENFHDEVSNMISAELLLAIFALFVDVTRSSANGIYNSFGSHSTLRKGDIDETKFQKPLIYYPVTGTKEFWEITGGIMVVNGQPTTHAIGPVRIKNLEPYILVPANVAADVYANIPNSIKPKHQGGIWMFPCYATEGLTVTFHFGSGLDQHTMYPEDFDKGPGQIPGYCNGAIRASKPTSTTSTFGLPFLKSFYTVYKNDAKGVADVIGIAKSLMMGGVQPS